jgi:hypothetical protein
MGCFAIFLNLLCPGLGTILFTGKRVAGFIQIAIAVANLILTIATFGIWGIIGFFIHLGLFAWALASTISYMSEQAAKKAIQQEREQQTNL